MKIKLSLTLTTFVTLYLVVFLSISTIANPVISGTGDILKSGVKKQITSTGVSISNNTKTAETDFSYLRFDVNNYTFEPRIADLPAASLDYLRFDVSKFIDANGYNIDELPAVTDYGYLQFFVNDYIETSKTDLTDMPENEFKYLRFDVTDFTGSTFPELDELPLN